MNFESSSSNVSNSNIIFTCCKQASSFSFVAQHCSILPRIILDKGDDGGVTDAVFQTIDSLIPESWATQGLEIKPDSETMKAVLEKAPELEKAATQMASVWLAGRRVDSVHSGLESQGLATIQVQVSGGRLMVMAAVEEVLSFFSDARRCLKTALEMLSKLSSKDLPDSFEMPSLAAVYVKTGDILYVPCGFVSVEKCISDTSIAIRTGLFKVQILGCCWLLELL